MTSATDTTPLLPLAADELMPYPKDPSVLTRIIEQLEGAVPSDGAEDHVAIYERRIAELVWTTGEPVSFEQAWMDFFEQDASPDNSEIAGFAAGWSNLKWRLNSPYQSAPQHLLLSALDPNAFGWFETRLRTGENVLNLSATDMQQPIGLHLIFLLRSNGSVRIDYARGRCEQTMGLAGQGRKQGSRSHFDLVFDQMWNRLRQLEIHPAS